jgi:hypothetical protein
VTAIEVYGADEGHLARIREIPVVSLVTLVEGTGGGQAIQVHTAAGTDATAAAVGVLDGLHIGRILVSEPTLEDAYLRLMADAVEPTAHEQRTPETVA